MKELLYRKIYDAVKEEIAGGRMKPGERLPGVRETAERWGTSPNTVLKALAELESDGLIEKTRGRGIFVRERADWLKEPKGGMIGLVMPDSGDPFYLRLLAAVENAAAARGYSLALRSNDAPASPEISGMIVIPGAEGVGSANPDANIPVIYTGKFNPPGTFAGNYVVSDLYGGFYDAAAALLAEGRERIVYIGGACELSRDPGYLAVRDVVAGTRNGFRQDYAASAGGWSADDGEAALNRLLLGGDFPDAVICGSDSIAAGALRACRAAGLSVPGDVCLIGSGDEDIAPLLEPPLTSIRIQERLLGMTAAGMLDEMISGRLAEGDKLRIRFDPEIIVRSTALGRPGPQSPGDTPDGEDELTWL